MTKQKMTEKAVLVEGPTQSTLIIPKDLTRRIGLKDQGLVKITQQENTLIIEGTGKESK